MHMGWNYGFGWLMMLFMMLFWLILIVGLVILIIWAVRRTQGPGGVSEDTALDTLNKRYARGEISREEYERMKQEISAK